MALYKFFDIAINSIDKKKPEENDKDVYIGLEHLDSQCLQVTRFGSEVAPIGEKLLMKKGDVLFGKRRAYQKKVAIAPFDGIFSAHGMVLRPKEAVIDKNYFPFFISSDYFLDAAIKISVGSLSPTINWNDLKNLQFELPSFDEQKKLAKILWATEKLKQKYQSIYLSKEKLIKQIIVEHLSSEPTLLGDIVNLFYGKSQKELPIGNEYPIMGTSGILGYSSRFLSKGNSILIGRKGTIDKPIYLETPFWAVDTAYYTENKIDVNTKWLYYYLYYLINFSVLNEATGVPSLNSEVVKKIKIFMPNLKTQDSVVNKCLQIDKMVLIAINARNKIKCLADKILLGVK